VGVFAAIHPYFVDWAGGGLAALHLREYVARFGKRSVNVVGALVAPTPPTHGRALADRLTNAELTLLPGLGHCPHIQDPDAFVAAIARFLGLPPPPCRPRA
jgi:pimeloyl-ACP methyl ester carboxylesterase